MKNPIQILERAILSHKTDTLTQNSKFREDSLVFIYHYSLQKTNDSDIASDVYLEAEKVIDRLIQKYISQRKDYYINYLKHTAKLLIMNRYKTLKNSNFNQHRSESIYAFSEKSYDTPLDSDSQIQEEVSEIQNAFKNGFLKKLHETNEEICYGFYLRYDIPMDPYIHWNFRKFLHKKQISYENWKQNHTRKKTKFENCKSKLVEQIHKYSFRIVNSGNNVQVSELKEKKRLKLVKLNALLNKGLYNSQELSEILGLNSKYILRTMSHKRLKGTQQSHTFLQCKEVFAA